MFFEVKNSSILLVVTKFLQHFSLKYKWVRILTMASSMEEVILFLDFVFIPVTYEKMHSTTALLVGVVRQAGA